MVCSFFDLEKKYQTKEFNSQHDKIIVYDDYEWRREIEWQEKVWKKSREKWYLDIAICWLTVFAWLYMKDTKVEMTMAQMIGSTRRRSELKSKKKKKNWGCCINLMN